MKPDFRQSLADALGESFNDIQTKNPRWLSLMQEGVLVSLHIGRWRGKTKLDWGDLGVDIAPTVVDEMQNIFDLGHKKLLPAELLKELDRIESGARKWLQKKAYKTYWGYFVPVTAYVEWKEKNEELQSRYFALRDRIVREYDEIVTRLLDDYRLAAAEAYRRLSVLSPMYVATFESEGAFVDAFIHSVETRIWSPEDIRASFYFNVELSYVPLPSLMAAENAEAERIELASWEAHREADAREEKRQAEIAAARSEIEWKEKLMRDMNRDVINQAQKQKEELVDDFLKDVVVQLRGLIYSATTDVLAAMKKQDSLPPRSVAQLRGLVDQVKALNFYGDEDAEAMINKVAFALGDRATDRDVPAIEGNLRDIGTLMRATLIGLGESPRGARMLGIADEPTSEMVRMARRGLGLDGEAGAPSPVPFRTFRQARLMEAVT